MSKYFVDDYVYFWKDGKRLQGTIYSAKRKVFGRIEYTIAVREPNGFDPDGIGRERYRYWPIPEDSVLGYVDVKRAEHSS